MNSRHCLHVEGPHDQAVMRALLKRHGLELDVQAPQKADGKGDGALLKSFRLAVKNGDARVGLLIDADSSVDQRWTEIAECLALEGIALPPRTLDGVIFASPRPDQRIGVWILPDNQRPGALEDLLVDLIPDPAHPLWTFAGEATSRARTLGASFEDHHVPKARLATWLAWQERPGFPYGKALAEKFFRHDTPLAERLVRWCRRLFAHPGAG
jgi:hypothetical protein